METLRYWIGASPEVPVQQVEDLQMLHDFFHGLDQDAVVEQYGTTGGMVLLKVEMQEPGALDFTMPGTVVAFEHRRS